MRTIYAAVLAFCVAVSPVTGFAQTEMVSPPSAPGLAKPVAPYLVAAGVVGAAVVADIVTRGALSRPLLRLLARTGIPGLAGGAATTAVVVP